MKLIPRSILLFLTFVLFAPFLPASTYFISTIEGNDSRSFLEAENPLTPWKTIGKLNSVFKSLLPGDSVLFKRGDVFDGNIVINKSGLEDYPIVLSAYGEGAKPLINGFTTVTGWTFLGNEIYESSAIPAGTRVNMLLIDGLNYAMGRYPNAETENGGYLTFESHTNQSITDRELAATPDWTGAELVLRTTRWVIDRLPISRHDNSSMTFRGASSYELTDDYGYFIQNHIKTLDQFGEWYYNPITRKMTVFFGNASPAEHKVQAATVDVLVDVKASHIVLDQLSLSGANRFAVFNDWLNRKDLLIKNCKISFSGIDGVHLSGRAFFRMDSCEIRHSNNNGITLDFRNTNARISSNLIINTGMQAGMGQNSDGKLIAIFGRATRGLIIENNTIINTGYIGVDFGQDEVLIKNNYINTFCIVKDDGAGIYTYTGPENTVYRSRQIVGNIIMNGIGAGDGTRNKNYLPAEGIYLDDNTTNVEVMDNTVANCAQNGLYIHNARDFIISDNTFYNNATQLSTVNDDFGNPISGGELNNNIFFSKYRHQWVASMSSISNDLGNIGKFRNNYYARPVEDLKTIFTEYNSHSSSKVVKAYDLAGWQQAYGQDQGSQISPLGIPKFKLNGLNGPNKYSRGNFNLDEDHASCYSPLDNCVVSWTSDSELDGGALEASGPGPFDLIMHCGSIDNAKQYVLRFSALAEREVTLEVFLRQRYAPYEVISELGYFKVGSERQDFEMLFTNPIEENNASIIISSEDNNLVYWLDNVGLYEADASLIAPEDYIRFEYNPTLSDKMIFLDANYIDVKKEAYTGSLMLRPFRSIILLRDTSSNNVVLPVTLNEFKSTAEDCAVKLQWRVETETYFSHYELERSDDGTIFKKISRIQATGDTTPQSYQYLDESADLFNYYRLKMVDLDGRFRYSNVLVEETDCREIQVNWNIYPNPVLRSNPVLTTRVYTISDTMTLSIVDQKGRIVKTKKSGTISGWNNITWNVADLPAGIYYIYHDASVPGKVYRFVVVRD